jgi:hypothetical protein
MRAKMGWAAALAVAAAGSAHAASLEVRNAAVRVVVIPEARSDVSVTVVKSNPRLPLKVINGASDQVIVDGGYWGGFMGYQSIHCSAGATGPVVNIWGVGRFAYDELPEILVRMPLDAVVRAGAGAFGAVSAANRLDLGVSGCGDWTVANVRDQMAVRVSGSGKVRTGAAGQMALEVTGSGSVSTREAANGLDAHVSGSGAIVVEQASGAIRARDSGSGQITINGGRASLVDAGASGSGGIEFKGDADDLQVGLSGSGGVKVAQVSGAVRARISGSGSLRIASGHAKAVEAHISGSGSVYFDGPADSLNASASGSGSVRIARVAGAVVSSTTGSGKVVIADR